MLGGPHSGTPSVAAAGVLRVQVGACHVGVTTLVMCRQCIINSSKGYAFSRSGWGVGTGELGSWLAI
jgi:hypothetical protein